MTTTLDLLVGISVKERSFASHSPLATRPARAAQRRYSGTDGPASKFTACRNAYCSGSGYSDLASPTPDNNRRHRQRCR